jgi:hypothetical protein
VREQRVGPLLVTGHSLGAALATLAAVDLLPDKLITFGSPRVGDANLAGWFNQIAVHRFVNCCDVVGRVPPERFDAEHFSQLFDELGLSSFASTALGQTLGWLRLPGTFVHLAPPRFIFSDGHVENDPESGRQATDQKTARTAYPHSPTNVLAQLKTRLASLPAPDRPGFIGWIKKLFTGPNATAETTATALSGLRASISELFRLAQSPVVPLRDLADHAPLNYFSGLAGRS